MKNMKNKIKLLGGMVIATLAMVATPALASQAIGVQPIKSEINMDPGETKVVTIDVINRTATDAYAHPTLESFSANDENGFPMDGEDESEDPQSILNWIDLPEEDILVPGNDRVSVDITINAPADAMPGGRYAALFYQPVVPEHENATGVKIITRVASLLIVRINGEVVEDGTVDNFGLDAQNLVTDNAVKFGVQFKNTGTVHVKPTGRIVLKDKDGNVIEGVGKVTDENEKEMVVDYIPVNNGAGNVLPNSSRTFLCEWLNPYFSEGMTATLQLTYGTKEEKMIEQNIDVVANADAEISSLHFNKEKQLFSFNLKNTGDFRIRPQFDLQIFNDFEFQVDSVAFDDETYIEPGEEREIKLTWSKNPPNGKYLAKVKFTSSILADLNIETYFRIGDDFLGSILDSGATPYVVILLVLAGIGSYVYRKKQKEEAKQNIDQNITQ